MRLANKYDLVIVGAGPAGLAAAIAVLRKIRISVLVIDGQARVHERIGENCPPETITLLRQLGLDQAFHASKQARCPGFASVWGREDVGYNDFIVNPMGPSWRLNRNLFDQMLVDQATDLGAQIVWSNRLVQATRHPADQPGYRLRTVNTEDQSTQEINARFVIDASGMKARFAKAIG